MQVLRILVVSKNNVMIENIRRWKSQDIEQGVLVVDHAKTKEEANVLAQQYKYDTVIQNGIHVIDIINKYQEGVEFAQLGKSKNNIYRHNIDAYSEEELNLLLSRTTKKPLKNGVRIEGWIVVGISMLTIMVSVVIAYQSLRSDVDHLIKYNAEVITENREIRKTLNKFDLKILEKLEKKFK